MSDLYPALVITINGYYDSNSPQVLKSVVFDAILTASGVEYIYSLNDIGDKIQEVITEVVPN